MAQNKIALKRRIRSVKATKKITSAMEMIATSKLGKQKSKMEVNRVFSNTLFHTFHRVLAKADLHDINYFKSNEGKHLRIVFVSDMGLCGAYNSNIVSYLKQNANKQDELWLVGSKEAGALRRSGFEVSYQQKGESLSYGHFTQLVLSILNGFNTGKFGRVSMVYTHFVNSMTFTPKEVQLLPLIDSVKPETASLEEEVLSQDIIFEPDAQTLIEQLVPMLLNSLLYSVWLESKTSEQASRRLAMDNATDNAQELIDDLVLKFNQSRQASITQEITEIVAGAEAL
jgi:F-type H+-transporting ATPase subunit gamma